MQLYRKDAKTVRFMSKRLFGSKSFTVLEDCSFLAVIMLFFALGFVGNGKPYLSTLDKRMNNICHQIIYGQSAFKVFLKLCAGSRYFAENQ